MYLEVKNLVKYYNKELPIIMKELNQLDVSIINVEIKKSSLEQVFLKLTKNESVTK